METIHSNDGAFSTTDPAAVALHHSKNSPMKVRCIKQHPPMNGFGRQLSVGDSVIASGLIYDPILNQFALRCESECAFYDYTFFEATN